MDTIKVAWMSLRLRPKSFPWVFREVRCTWAREGGLLSHPMLRIKSLLIFQEAHSPILPFAHLFCFSILPPPPLFPLFLFFPLPRMNFVARNQREKPVERISFFPSSPPSKNIYDRFFLLRYFARRIRSNHASFHCDFQYDLIDLLILGWWYRDPRCVCVETLLIDVPLLRGGHVYLCIE